MRGRTITLTVTDQRGKAAKTIPLYQYDYGQKLLIEGVELPEYYEVHFSNQQYGDAVTVLGDSTGALIPDSLVATGESIYVWLYLHDTSYDGETEYMGVIPVIKRAEPSDITPTPEEQSIITEVIAALNNMEDDMSDQVNEAKAAKEAAEDAQAGAEAAESAVEGYASAAEAAKEAAETAQTAAETAQAAAEAASNSATTAYNNADSARSSAVSAKEYAETAATNASTSATSASGYATNAQNSASSALDAQTAAETAQGKAEAAQTAAEAAQAAAEAAEDGVEADALIAEGYAVGKQNGEDVASGSTYYHNNAKYYADAASDSATAAAGSEDNAEDSAEDAEAYAVGTRGGVDVESDDPAYENNAKYYAEEAATVLADKLDAPSTAGTAGQVLTSDGEGGQAWADPSGAIDDTAGAGDTDVTWSANKLDTELTDVLNAIAQLPEEKTSIKTGVDLDFADPNGNVVLRLEDGEVETKNFNSKEAITEKNSTKSGVDLDFSDPNGNVVLRVRNGRVETAKGDICYVATNGSDTNKGDETHPFATIQKAIDDGFKRIMVAPGEYKNQKVNINGKHGISIICNTNTKENNIFESHKRQARAKIDNSIDVTGFEAYNSIWKTALSVGEDSSYYKVFVSEEVDPVYSGSDYYGRVTTYNAILWEITDSILTCTRLVPKLSLAECETTAGTFFYDGTDLYVNPTGGSMTGKTYKRMNDDTFTAITRGFYIYNSTDIYIEGIDVQFFPYYDFHANLVSGLIMRDCGFFFTCYGSAAEYQYCNGDMWECNAAQAGADGFGIASGGNTSFYNCNAVLCYDDGISHHDESTGIIDGGIWTYCKKGGVTPSYGSHVTVKNVIATHNVYGIYWPQSGERVTDGVQYMQNCLAVDNTTKDIKLTGYDVVAHGCSYGTKEVDTGATLTEYNCTVIS